MKQVKCPAPDPHGPDCICEGSGEIRVAAATAFCTVCGDPETKKNLGFVSRVAGEVIGSPCTACGAIGDPDEYLRREQAAHGTPAVAAFVPESPIAEASPPAKQSARTELRVVRFAETGRIAIVNVMFGEDQIHAVFGDGVSVEAPNTAALSALVVDIASAFGRPLVESSGHRFWETVASASEALGIS